MAKINDGRAKTTGSKILFGAKPRTRIPCTLPELKALDAEASNAVLTQAMNVVERVNLDDMYFEDMIKFGAQLQAEHADITERDLELARESALPEAHRLHVEISAKLRDLNPSKVFGLNENMLQRLWRRLLDQNLPSFQTAYSVAIATKRRAAGQGKSWLRGLRDNYNQILDALKGA